MTSFKQMMAKVTTKMHHDGSAHGDRCVTGEEINASVDTSSLTIGVVLERHCAILEDTFCLRLTNDALHINLV